MGLKDCMGLGALLLGIACVPPGLAQVPVAGRPVPRVEEPVDISQLPVPDAQENLKQQRYLVNLTQLGRALFEDKHLSGSGRLACVSCHDPAHAFSAPDKRAVQRGGLSGKQAGTRAVPSLQYLQTSPVFVEHFFEDEGAKAGQDAGPTGGLTWDGRVDSLRAQARIPLFSVNEMAATPTHMVNALRHASYADDFKSLFGSDIFDHPDTAIEKSLLALETYQQLPSIFYPYTSKFDAVLRGQAQLTVREARGLDAFNREDKGNCASCHPSEKTTNGGLPQFTDYGYAALGLPRNMRIPANANARYFDMGLCGPARTDLTDNKGYCGLFKVPSLRNVARKAVFYHNAAATDLASAVRFYAERDTRPYKWYPRGGTGHIRKFNDLPAQFRGNVEADAPFGHTPGSKPVLSAADVQDIVAFLKTLTDGYRP